VTREPPRTRVPYRRQVGYPHARAFRENGGDK
jgi:hypothetical protein